MNLHLNPESVRIDDYTYILPDDMIARFPLVNRAGSKLLVYDRGSISHTTFRNIAGLTGGDELMIFNNTRVIKARILMSKDSGAKIEIFLLEPLSPAEYNIAFSSPSGCRWKCMVGNKKRWKRGKLNKKLTIEGKKATLSSRIVKDHDSWQEIEFLWEPGYIPFSLVIDKVGLTPIPPYLDRMPVDTDETNYQTVYSRFEGSVAAPTAGLHFTPEILEELKNNGTLLGEVTLHVGAGTFLPVKSVTAGGHPMHTEHFSVSLETLKKIRTKQGKITAVGTTSIRVLESIYWLGVKQMIHDSKHPVQDHKDRTQDRKQLQYGKNHLHHIDNQMHLCDIPQNNVNRQPDKSNKQQSSNEKQQNSNEKQQSTERNIKAPMLLSQWEHLQLPQNVPFNEALDAIVGRLVQEGLHELDTKTEIMIIPGYRFRVADKMITNFHQPGSTLLLLIAAFIGEDWRKVYDYALKNNFRFLSYGDSSLLIPGNKGTPV